MSEINPTILSGITRPVLGLNQIKNAQLRYTTMSPNIVKPFIDTFLPNHADDRFIMSAAGGCMSCMKGAGFSRNVSGLSDSMSDIVADHLRHKRRRANMARVGLVTPYIHHH